MRYFSTVAFAIVMLVMLFGFGSTLHSVSPTTPNRAVTKNKSNDRVSASVGLPQPKLKPAAKSHR